MPEEGRGKVNGFDIFKDREKVRTSVSFLMSGGWVIFDYKLSVRDNLKYWGVYQGLRLKEVDQKVEEALKVVDLYKKIDDYPEHLSSGMRQRMNLARCLMADRPIYLLDEPTANVDAQSAEFIRTFVKNKLKKDNKTIILATHNLWEAEAICDKLVILNESKVLMVDKTENIKRNIGREMAILKLASPSQNILNAIQGMDYVELAMLEENDLKVFGDVRRHLPEIMDICQASSKVEWVDIKEPSLYEIFMQLTGREKK